MTTPRSLWKRLLRLACGGVLATCAAAAIAAAAPAAPTAPAAMLTVPLAPAQAQQAILLAVRQLPPQREEHRRYRLALPFGAPLFPPDDDFALALVPPAPAPARAPASAPASGLAGWLALSATQRRHDVLITPDVDYYWSAEGRQFSCQFIIHLEAHGTGTRLVTLQVRPTEYAGKHFELLGRTGPGRYIKLLPSTPSAQSEAELRTFLAAALARQQ